MDNPIWHQLLVAVALVLVLEGVMPFLSPKSWREMLIKIQAMPDHNIRISALICMLLGVALLYWLKH
jgi:uncharacterized protein YjeT (DUF2065 family)